MSYSLTFVLKVSLEVTKKMTFLGITFNELFSNRSRKAFDVFSKDAILSWMLSGITYGVLSSA